MPLTVLSVGYSLAPVGPDAVGGAEQVLSALDRALVEAGHHSVVVANLGSQTAGTLVPSGPVPPQITEDARAEAQRRHRQAVAEALARFPVDLVHSHALDFADHLPTAEIPTLVTLASAARLLSAGERADDPPANLVQLRLGEPAAQLSEFSHDAAGNRERGRGRPPASPPGAPQFRAVPGPHLPRKGV